ncbi:MAG TPA: proton-conducting transporter membrane subunit [Gemmatimonadales bacterium]|nr:proton-conducting transporter membrane subunit [Gemmatimonadales bacterium]
MLSSLRLLALVLVPALTAAAAFRAPRSAIRSSWLLGTGGLHLALLASLWLRPAGPVLGGWLAVDGLGLIVLTVASVLFLVVAHYAVGYLVGRTAREGRVFSAGMLVFLAAASLVSLSHHLALLWVGMEATTLSMAPLIYDRHDRRSLEAVWKYLVLSSVGIAFALLAVFLLATAQPSLPGTRPLVLEDLAAGAAALDHRWLRAAFVFALVGFGTKMGLAPLHTWKPDTYGEAPSLVGGLMAGGVTTCAFLGLARFTQVLLAAGLGGFARPLLLAFGLFSLAVAAAFIIGQADVKRLLAYSSVEHMGLLALGLGLGGLGAYGSVLHALNNALVKGLLFLVIGNLVLAAGSSAAVDVRGMLRVRPVSATLAVVGLFAVTGSPPFGLFLSEFAILSGAFRQHHPVVAVVALLLLAVIFVGLARMILEMVLGEPLPAEPSGPGPERSWMILGPLVLAALVLMLGSYLPGALQEQLAGAASALGGAAP